jgi:phosphoglycerate dehydrogenase-like enzyme
MLPMRRLKVLLLATRGGFSPWCKDVIRAVGDRHDLRILDAARPLAPQFAGVEAVIDQGGSAGTRAMMDVARDARLWQILGTGFDHFDLEYLRSRGIPAANCPGPFSAVALAEAAMMLILMLARRYRESDVGFRAGVLHEPVGRELEGRRLGIIGLGASGRELARRARAFGMRVLAIDARTIEPEVLAELQPEFVGTLEELDRVIAASDFLSLHLHLNAQTRHLIDVRRLGLMGPSACLINVARGALVEEEALFAALLAGRLGGAGLDVFSREPPNPAAPVFQLPNVVVTPHIAGATEETSRRRAACAAENVDRVAQGLEPLHRIDRCAG